MNTKEFKKFMEEQMEKMKRNNEKTILRIINEGLKLEKK